MNETIKQHLIKHNEGKGWPTDNDSLRETLLDADPIKETLIGSRRWWDDYFSVVDIGGMLIGFDSARTTGDNSPTDAGWVFNPASVCQVVAKEVTTTVYVRVQEEPCTTTTK